MKLIVFINKQQKLESAIKEFIKKIISENIMEYVDKSTKDKMPDEIYTMIRNIDSEIIIQNSGQNSQINLHKVINYPTVIINHDDIDICKWEGKLPSMNELVLMIKNYVEILKISIPEIDWSIDD